MDGRGRTHFKKRLLRAATFPDTVVRSSGFMGSVNSKTMRTNSTPIKRKFVADHDEETQQATSSLPSAGQQNKQRRSTEPPTTGNPAAVTAAPEVEKVAEINAKLCEPTSATAAKQPAEKITAQFPENITHYQTPQQPSQKITVTSAPQQNKTQQQPKNVANKQPAKKKNEATQKQQTSNVDSFVNANANGVGRQNGESRGQLPPNIAEQQRLRELAAQDLNWLNRMCSYAQQERPTVYCGFPQAQLPNQEPIPPPHRQQQHFYQQQKEQPPWMRQYQLMEEELRTKRAEVQRQQLLLSYQQQELQQQQQQQLRQQQLEREKWLQERELQRQECARKWKQHVEQETKKLEQYLQLKKEEWEKEEANRRQTVLDLTETSTQTEFTETEQPPQSQEQQQQQQLVPKLPQKINHESDGRVINSCVSIISSGNFTNNSAIVCLDSNKKFPTLATIGAASASTTTTNSAFKLEPVASQDYLSASDYVDEIEMVSRLESDSSADGKYIFELYKFVTKLQIVSNGRPMSFRLFRKLYQSRQLEDIERIFVKYLSNKAHEDHQGRVKGKEQQGGN